MKIQIALIASVVLMGCSKYAPGPDKQGAGIGPGLALGAVSGGVIGMHYAGAAGPGAAWAGAGIGAISGAIKGAMQDASEEERKALADAISRERETSFVHARLSEHYDRRMEIHPTRDIYPADWFFSGDKVKLNPAGRAIVREIAKLNRDRMPYSRLGIVVYVKSKDETSEYAQYLSKERAAAISDFLIRNGIEPKRLEPRAQLVSEPLLLDRHDDPERYNQAIEIILLDR